MMIGKAAALIQIPNQRLFSTSAAAKYLGVCPDTLRKYADLGWIEAKQLDRRRVFALEDLESFVESLPPYRCESTLATAGNPVDERR